MELTNQPITVFRAWDIRKQEMFPNALLLTSTGPLVQCLDVFNDPFAFFDGCIWMQKHPTLNIFEGDILKDAYIDGDTQDEHPAYYPIVRANNGGFYMDMSFKKDGSMLESIDPCYAVIGNIYENKELLPYMQNGNSPL